MADLCLTVDLEPDCPPYLRGWTGVELGMPEVLDLFARHELLGTVFATGATAERYPDLIRRIVDTGHELGCHGHSHRSFATLGPDEAEREIARSAALLRSFAPVTSFRAPYLDFPERYVPLLEAHGFTIDGSRSRYKPTHWFRTPAVSPVLRIPASTTSSVLRAPPVVRDLLFGFMRTPVVLFVHPWEFVDQSDAPIPWDCRVGTGTAALASLSSTIEFFAQRGHRFVRMMDLQAVGSGGAMSANPGSDATLKTSLQSRLFRARGLWLAVTLVAMYVALVPLHTQDGANHRQVAVLLERLISAETQDPVYEPNLGVLRTNVLFSGGYALAAAKVGISIHLYERLFVGAFLVLLLVGYRGFLAEWIPRRADLWVWILPVTTHALFVTGMYNFLAATALALPLLTLLKRLGDDPSAKTLAAMCALAWLAFLAHPFPFFVLPVAWLWLASGRRERPEAYMWIGGGVLVGFLLLGFVLPMAASTSPPNPYAFKPPLELLAGLVYYNFPSFSPWALLAAVPALVAAVAMAWMTYRNGDGRGRLLWLAMLVAYFLFPNEGHGGAHLNERFLPFVWIFLPLGLYGVGAGHLSWTRWIRGTAVASTVLMAAALWAGLSRVDREVRDAAAVLSELPDQARLYPLEFDPGGSSLTGGPLLHLWANHPTDRTVHSAFSFTFMDLMPVSRRIPSSDAYFPAAPENHAQGLAEGRFCRPRDPVSTPNCSLQERDAWVVLMSAARYYDYWFAHGAPTRWRQAIDEISGLNLVAEVGRASLWRYDLSRGFSPKLRSTP